MKNKTAVVISKTGFIGSNLAKTLSNNNVFIIDYLKKYTNKKTVLINSREIFKKEVTDNIGFFYKTL
jgi:hypothetical protein